MMVIRSDPPDPRLPPIYHHVLQTSLEDEDHENDTEDDNGEDHECSSGNAVAARNGLWVTVRCRPYCAAAVKPEKHNVAVKLQPHGLPLSALK